MYFVILGFKMDQHWSSISLLILSSGPSFRRPAKKKKNEGARSQRDGRGRGGERGGGHGHRFHAESEMNANDSWRPPEGPTADL